MDKVKNIFVWILMILGIIVLGVMAVASVKSLMAKKSAGPSLQEQVQRAQLSYYTLGGAQAASEMASELPATNSTAQFQPI